MVAVCVTMSAVNETMNEPRAPHVGTAGRLTRALWKCLQIPPGFLGEIQTTVTIESSNFRV